MRPLSPQAPCHQPVPQPQNHQPVPQPQNGDDISLSSRAAHSAPRPAAKLEVMLLLLLLQPSGLETFLITLIKEEAGPG